ncbi:MAG: LysR family transcriptional regulator, partial [Pseudomonadota bacterium]
MPLARRFLPPLHWLAAFEAAARLGSFSAAARELALTQSAVSKQVAGLETRLETQLFVRERQSVRLTAAGEQYAIEVRSALQQLASASLNLRANPEGGTLHLAVLPTFGARWLAPRLADFVRLHPGVTLNLTTRIRPFDVSEADFDAAIAVGSATWPGTEQQDLMSETLLPACSPDLKREHAFAQPADLLRAPLMNREPPLPSARAGLEGRVLSAAVHDASDAEVEH